MRNIFDQYNQPENRLTHALVSCLAGNPSLCGSLLSSHKRIVLRSTLGMTLAICISCGTEKFGALVPCLACGFHPNIQIDKAKSLLLSDWNYPADELYRLASLIKSSQQIPYDPLCLAQCADTIAEETYFWDHFDTERRVLPCMRCGTVFRPQADETFCSRCAWEAREALCLCSACNKLFEGDARHCQQCGNRVVTKPDLTPYSIGSGLAVAVRRVITTSNVWGKFETLGEIQQALPETKRGATELELEILAMYSSTVAVRQIVPSSQLAERVIQAMLQLYRKGWAMGGGAPADVEHLSSLCARRMQEYNSATAIYPDKRTFGVAEIATKNCLGTEKNLKAIVAMMLVIQYFVGVLRHYLNSTISDKRT